MSSNLSKSLISVIYLLACFSVEADSSVWKIEKNNSQLFIGGTLHFLTDADYPLPGAYQLAYSQSGRLVFETDIKKLQAPETQQKMIRRASYQAGKSLRDDLDRETFAAVEQFFSSRRIPIDNMLQFKPGLVSITMIVMELQRLGLAGTGIDLYFHDKASRDNKAIGQLESVETQIDFLASLGEGQENEFMRYTLADIDRLPRFFQAIKNAWLAGDIKVLEEIALRDIRTNFPKVYQSSIVERNNAWIPQIKKMTRSKETEFILVGAAHLAGEHGLLAQLKSDGYRITQLP